MRIYIGNIRYNTGYDEFRNFLEEKTGKLLDLIWITHDDKPKPFCFVDIDDADEERFIESLNGHEFKGRPLVVNQARPKRTFNR